MGLSWELVAIKWLTEELFLLGNEKNQKQIKQRHEIIELVGTLTCSIDVAFLESRRGGWVTIFGSKWGFRSYLHQR